MASINFHMMQSNFSLRDRTRLKKFIVQIFKKEGKALESLDYIFCSDDYLLQINRQFLNHDFYTDIITFDLSSKSRQTIGEIYISIDRVKDNAKNLNVRFQEELHRVIFHGVLHLCGYKDKLKPDIKIMREMENRYLAKYLD
ncbi:MAG: rRNA maturation RNase YbeY [Bacteroidetes bacterium]|nr:MAG: rRNA maturation RNase YbeY [Bacteroidota bacterium]